jgi:predicted RNase H-like nuclease (RuvC/YqgF family)
MNFQSDTYARARSIHQLKQKIIEKTKAIDQLKRALVLTDMRIVKSTKNVQTLQVCFFYIHVM